MVYVVTPVKVFTADEFNVMEVPWQIELEPLPKLNVGVGIGITFTVSTLE